MGIDRFLADSNGLLKEAFVRDRERAELEAHRFTVSNYLRTDELSLSRIIGDLLDPQKDHGQGSLFLEILLRQLHICLEGLRSELVDVQFEKTIYEQRRIDVYVRIPTGGTDFCLAIENKPHASDLKNQIRDYLAGLQKIHGESFLLLYFSGAGQTPSQWSLGSDFERFRTRAKVVPYCYESVTSSQRANSVMDFAQCSVVSWISACRNECKAKKLQWFLQDIKLYCEREFGDRVVSNIEIETLSSHLLSSRENCEAAQSVSNAWPIVQSRVHEEFLKRLCEALCQRLQQSELAEFTDIKVDYKFRNKSGTDNRLWLYRESWKTYTREGTADSNNRTSIRLESLNRIDWRYGVSSPCNKDDIVSNEMDRRIDLNKKLEPFQGEGASKADVNWWPLIVQFDRSKRNWDDSVYEMHKENEAGHGEITDYFVNALLKLATFAIPKINEVEGREAD